MKRKNSKTLPEANARIEELEKQVKHLAKYTTFGLNPKEARAVSRFQMKHIGCERGAIGGAVTVCFGITSLGCTIVTKCHCGVEKNVTDFSVW